jgi:hypothetical protein
MAAALSEMRRELDDALKKVATAEARLGIRLANSESSILTFAQKSRIRQEPGYSVFQKRSTRRYIDFSYGDFFESTQLAPKTRETLKCLIEEKMLVDAIHELPPGLGVSPKQPARLNPVAQTKSKIKTEIDDEIFALLGPELFHRYRTAVLIRTMDTSKVDAFKARLVDQGFPPLSDAQAQSLLDARRDAAYPWIRGGERNKILQSGDGAPDPTGTRLDARVEELASTALLPEQLAALRELHRDYRAEIKIRKRIESEVSGKVAPAR